MFPKERKYKNIKKLVWGKLIQDKRKKKLEIANQECLPYFK